MFKKFLTLMLVSQVSHAVTNISLKSGESIEIKPQQTALVSCEGNGNISNFKKFCHCEYDGRGGYHLFLQHSEKEWDHTDLGAFYGLTGDRECNDLLIKHPACYP